MATALALSSRTGKTLWLSYALGRLLTENKAVAYHSLAGTFLFFRNSVYSRILGEATAVQQGEPAIFCLIDSDQNKPPVDISFMTDATVVYNTFPIMAASPNPLRYDTWRKQRELVPMEFMPLCERYELKKGLEIQPFYDDLRQHVETVVRSRRVDDSSTRAVTENLRRKDWDKLILSALKMIGDGDDPMDDATGDDTMSDATGDDATDNATVDVDRVLDKSLDNAIGAYGLSARDIYLAIRSPAFFKTGITEALEGQKYKTLRETVILLERLEASDTSSHTIFSMRPTEPPGNAHLRESRGFEVQFKFHSIKGMVLKHLEFFHHLDTVFLIKELKGLPPSSSFAGFLYEGFAVKELATRESSPNLVLMRAEKGQTKFVVPIEPDRIVESDPMFP